MRRAQGAVKRDIFAALKSLVPHANQSHHDYMASTFEIGSPEDVFFNQNQIWAFQGLAAALGFKKLPLLPVDDGSVIKMQRSQG